METVRSTDGFAIAYRRSGVGPPLVLVHGTTADHARWAPVLPALEEHFTVCTVDRRGRGGSEDAAAYSIEGEFEDVAAIVDSIGEPVNLLGHSFGAICSLEASLCSHNVRKLVLYEPPIPTGISIYPVGAAARIQTLVEAGERDSAVTTFLREIARVPPHELALLQAAPAWQGRVAAAHTIAREMQAAEEYVFDPARFRSMQTPTLLLLGGDSPPFLKAGTAAVEAALPDVRVTVMPGQQHTAMNTAPDLFARAVLQFLVFE
jgi:pimeloyl-ACP methyl ester carboxylesterase